MTTAQWEDIRYRCRPTLSGVRVRGGHWAHSQEHRKGMHAGKLQSDSCRYQSRGGGPSFHRNPCGGPDHRIGQDPLGGVPPVGGLTRGSQQSPTRSTALPRLPEPTPHGWTGWTEQRKSSRANGTKELPAAGANLLVKILEKTSSPLRPRPPPAPAAPAASPPPNSLDRPHQEGRDGRTPRPKRRKAPPPRPLPPTPKKPTARKAL